MPPPPKKKKSYSDGSQLVGPVIVFSNANFTIRPIFATEVYLVITHQKQTGFLLLLLGF